MLSHKGARELWNSNRLAPDQVVEACAAKGRVIGVEAAPHTTLTRNNTTHSLESVMEHFEYIAQRVGIDHVAFGPDTIYGDHVGLHGVYAEAVSIQHAHKSGSTGPKNLPFKKVEYVAGLEKNPSEGSKNIVRWLVKRGYSDDDNATVMGGNVLRVLGRVWG